MGALKNLCHDELEAKRYAADEFPELAWLFGRFAETIATDLCASDRAKGEHYVIAANLLPIVADEIDRRADAPELTPELAARAQISVGGKVVRPATGTLTQSTEDR